MIDKLLTLKDIIEKGYSILKNRLLHRKIVAIIGKNKNCIIRVPVYKKEVFDETINVIIESEMNLVFKIYDFCKRVDKHIKIGNEFTDDAIEIIVTGPISNSVAYTYFKDFFKNITWHLNENKYIDSKRDYESNRSEYWPPFFDDNFYIMNNNYEQALKYGNKKNDVLEFISGRKDYAVLIKIGSEDFQDYGNNKTVHILFGLGRIGTERAIHIFVNRYKDIYKITKNGHYCLAYEINGVGNINYKKPPLNLTSHFFRS